MQGMSKKLRAFGLYALIVVAGLGCGLAVAKLPSLFKKNYVEGDYSAYYQNASARVVLYGTKTCPYCTRTREYLKARNIAFADLDVEDSENARKEFAQLGGGGVPVILVGNRRIQGFNRSALDAALESQPH